MRRRCEREAKERRRKESEELEREPAERRQGEGAKTESWRAARCSRRRGPREETQRPRIISEIIFHGCFDEINRSQGREG